MTGAVQNLFRYPIKGLSAESLESVRLEPGLGLPLDRHFALARATTRFDPDHPQWLPKRNFLMLMLDGRLAALETRFDEDNSTLTIVRGGSQVARGDIHTPAGRAVIEDFFSAYLGDEAGGKPRLVEAPERYMFSDHKTRVVSIINLASVRELERVTRSPVDPLRFRANVYVDGLEPWAEFGLIDRTIRLGESLLRIEARITRCAATNVEPGTGLRNMNIPQDLRRAFSHVDMGIYAAVSEGGVIRRGDRLEIAEPPSSGAARPAD